MENSKKPTKVRVPKKKAEPKASDLRAPPKKEPGKAVGRPKELGTKVQELRDKLLNSEDSSRIVQKVINKALDDTDKDQMVALKLCMDRILPVSMFEKNKDARGSIQINITGLTDVVIDGNEPDDVEDAKVVDEQ